ncbi:Nuclear pore complex protein Nup160, partial [Geodia barretti]
GLPVRTELRQFSVINKLWASVVPSAFRGAGPAEDCPMSIVMHSFGGNTVVLALCRDIHLRLWAAEPAECIMTCDLEEYLVQDTESESSLTCVNLCLRKAAESTGTSLRFAVYIETNVGSQVSVFQLLVVDRQLHLEHISSFPCIMERNLVDMCCTNSEVWAIWNESDGGECVKHLTYDGELCHAWKKATLSSLPPQDVFVSPNAEPRTFFLDAIFKPGRFSISAIHKALEVRIMFCV